MGNQFGCNGCISCSTQLPPSTLTAEDKISLERISMSGLSSDVVKALATVGITPTSDCSHVKAELLLQAFSDLDKDRRDGSAVEVVEEEILEEEKEEEEDSDGEASSSHPGQEELAPSNRVYSLTELKALSIQENMVIFCCKRPRPLSSEMNLKVRKIMNNLINENEQNKERDNYQKYNHETSKTTRFIRVSDCVA